MTPGCSPLRGQIRGRVSHRQCEQFRDSHYKRERRAKQQHRSFKRAQHAQETREAEWGFTFTQVADNIRKANGDKIGEMNRVPG